MQRDALVQADIGRDLALRDEAAKVTELENDLAGVQQRNQLLEGQ